MNGTPMHLIRLENLTRRYGDLLALEARDVALPPGAIGLLGPNGAGKSTLLKVLLGLLEPTTGRAEVFGLDVRSRSYEIRSRVGYLSETESFVPRLKAVELVALAGEVTGMSRRDAHRRAHEVLTYLGVEESRYRNIEDLPTGVRQRIQLAQALVHDPELLVLDEPTNGLDPAGRRAMLALVRSLHADFGKSVVLSSHLLEDVDRVCDSVLILDRGRVLEHGRIDILRRHLRNRYRLRVTGDPSRFIECLRGRGVTVSEEKSRNGEGLEFLAEVPQGFAAREILAALVGSSDGPESPAVLRDLRPDEEKLSDLFERIVASTPAREEAGVAGS